MKTPHRLIHDAKEAGVITEAEWRAFMRARNESVVSGYEFSLSRSASNALSCAFVWSDNGGVIFWHKISVKLKRYQESKQEAKQ